MKKCNNFKYAPKLGPTMTVLVTAFVLSLRLGPVRPDATVGLSPAGKPPAATCTNN